VFSVSSHKSKELAISKVVLMIDARRTWYGDDIIGRFISIHMALNQADK